MASMTEAELLALKARKEAGESVPELDFIDGIAGSLALPPGVPSTAGLVDRMKIVRWALDNVKDLETLMALYALWQEQATIQGRWDVLKSVGDLIVDDLASFPVGDNGLFSAASVYDPQGMNENAEYNAMAEEQYALAEAKAVDWGKLFDLAGTILPVIVELLLRLRG